MYLDYIITFQRKL